jgi:protein SCO1/2
MKKSLFLIILIIVSLCLAAQEMVPSERLGKRAEVGIEEQLGDTIPQGLWFFDENNDTVSLSKLIDKPTILCFVYFDCPNLCSPLMDGVADVVSKLDLQLGTDFQIITISFNTKDTPEKAREKKVNFVQKISKENRKHWIYLTGTQENIDAVTDAAGYRFKAQGLDFAHPSAIMVLSPAGKITRYLYGLTYLPFDAKMAIIEAQKGIARPSINKVLDYCFAYNPASKTYTLQVTRIMFVIIIFIAMILFITLLVRGRKNLKKNN